MFILTGSHQLELHEAITQWTSFAIRVRRFSGLFWPIFDCFRGGNINFVYDPRENNRKVGSKEPENRQNLISKEVL
jgi:hypothetical protein